MVLQGWCGYVSLQSKAMRKFVLSIACFTICSVYAQERSIQEVYAMMVFNLTKYVQWPDYASEGEFVIGVVGNDDIYKTLTEQYGGKQRGKKIYTIKKFRSVTDLTDCSVIFLDNSKSSEFEALKNKIEGKETLLITDKNGLGSKGSAINFKTVESKLKFELNQKVVENTHLKISNTLLSMAILI